ncbi:MAG: hypothetical protein ACREPM_13915 [Gemmatimonadaceae bacterium]
MGFRCSRWTRHFAAFVFAVCLSSSARAVSAQAVVRGILYDDASGAALRGSVMLIDPQSNAAVVYAATDSAGMFTLRVGDGVYQIGAVRPGYVSVLSAPVSLQNGEQLSIRVPIAQSGDPQHKIGVTQHVRPSSSAIQGRDASLAATSFANRRSLGLGLHYGRQEFERDGGSTLGEFLRSVPGLAIIDPTSMTSAHMSRDFALGSMSGSGAAACHIGWFLDGRRMDLPGESDPLTDGLGLMRLDTIEGVEVFRGVSEMPAEFADPDLRCGAIAIWTRRG